MIIAEIGPNHDGDFNKAKELIRIAQDCGADAVKFQIYSAEKLVHPGLKSLVGNGSQLERLKSLQFTDDQWEELYEMSDNFLATCFDLESLQKWGPRMSHIKISSGDLTYTELLRESNLYGKPILLSTGMATYEEIEEAVRVCPNAIPLHCVSSYPCQINDANLGVIPILKEKYGKVGYSDHTHGILACYTAFCMGADIIEKHFTDQHRDYGDHRHSANPEEFGELVRLLEDAKAMKGTEKPCKAELEFLPKLRRSYYASHNIDKYTHISEKDRIALRPYKGHSLNLGTKTRRNYEELEWLS